MATTATRIKLPSALKSELEKLARRSGETTHAVMVRALSEHVAAAKPGEVAQVIQAGYRNGTVASYPASRWCRSARMTTASTASSQSYKAT